MTGLCHDLGEERKLLRALFRTSAMAFPKRCSLSHLRPLFEHQKPLGRSFCSSPTARSKDITEPNPNIHSGDPWPRLQALNQLRQAQPEHHLFKKGKQHLRLKHASFDGTVFHSAMPPIPDVPSSNIASFMLDELNTTGRPASDSGNLWFIDPQSGAHSTFQQAKERTQELVNGLHQIIDLKPDQVVVLHAPNHVDYGPICWAAFRLGGIIALTSPSSTPLELSRQLDLIHQKYHIKAVISHSSVENAAKEAIKLSKASGPFLFTIDGAGNGSLEEALRSRSTKASPPAQASQQRKDNKIAFLAFSSGTTGLPKAVEITHKAVITNILQFYEAWKNNDRITPGQSRSLATLPFCHIYGLIVVLHFNLYAQTALVIQEKFQPRQFFNLVQQHQVTHLWLVPPLAHLLSRLPDKEPSLASVKHIIVGAAPISEKVFEQLRRVMPQCDSGQDGLTETSVVVSVYPGAASQPFPAGSAGALISGVSAKIIDPTSGQPLGIGETGELWSKSASNAVAYLGDAAMSESTWDQEGFCHTGDEAFFDHDGVLFLTDRIKELIKVKGLPVAPGELEGILMQHSSVVDVCVVGKPSKSSGEVPQAFVVLHDQAQASQELVSELKNMVAEVCAPYKHLADVHFIDAIPRNAAGKALRRQLKQA